LILQINFEKNKRTFSNAKKKENETENEKEKNTIVLDNKSS